MWAAKKIGFDEAIKRLESVQGPAEDGLPGERGVGEIAKADELRQYVARTLRKARGRRKKATRNQDSIQEAFQAGHISALMDLRDHLARTDGQRSDLSNAPVLAHADNKTPTP